MAARKATRQEVQAAVEKACVVTMPVYGSYDEKQGKRPVLRDERKLALASKADIAQVVVEGWGIKVGQQQYVSRAATLRQHVSLNSVYKHLQDLVSDGVIVAVPGTHWSVSGKYGSNKRSVYYLSSEAKDIAEATRFDKRDSAIASSAKEKAREAILAKYADEVAALEQEILEEEQATASKAERLTVLWPSPQQSLLHIV